MSVDRNFVAELVVMVCVFLNTAYEQETIYILYSHSATVARDS